MNSGNAVDSFEEEYDWADLETDLYHWTKTLRPVQVLLRSWFPLRFYFGGGKLLQFLS